MNGEPEHVTGAQDKTESSFLSGVGCWSSLVVIGSSLLLFGIACATPAMVFDKETWPGVQVLVLGWQGAFLGQFAWFANVFWFLSLFLIFLRRWMLAVGAAFVTLLVALGALSFLGTTVPLDEGFVNTMVFKSYHIGYYFWIASIGIVGLGAIVISFIDRRIRR